MRRKRKKLSLAKRILLELDDFGNAIVTLNRYGRSLTYHGYREKMKEINMARFERNRRRALKDLERRKMITLREKGDAIYFAMTEKAQRWLLVQRCANAPQCSQDTCTLVIFDIPEVKSNLRNYFRKYLKQIGFRQLQKSVWVCDKDVMRPLQEIIRLSDADPWITVFRASQ